MDSFENLRNLKELLDEGILTQEEFNIRKDQILFPEKAEEEKRKREEERLRQEREEKRKQEEEKRRLEEERQRQAQEAGKKVAYEHALKLLHSKTIDSYKKGIAGLEQLGDWGDAKAVAEKYREELIGMEAAEEKARKEKERSEVYNRAIKKFEIHTYAFYKSAIDDLESLDGWKDSAEIIEEKKPEMQTLKKEEQEKTARQNKIIKIAVATAALLVLFLILMVNYIYPEVIVPANTYKEAVSLYEKGDYSEARLKFSSLGDYKDSYTQVENCYIAIADKDVADDKNLVDALKTYRKFQSNKNVTDEKMEKCQESIYKMGKLK